MRARSEPQLNDLGINFLFGLGPGISDVWAYHGSWRKLVVAFACCELLTVRFPCVISGQL